MTTDAPLCPWCEQRFNRVANLDLHPSDTSRQRLRHDLATACHPRYCPPVTNRRREPK